MGSSPAEEGAVESYQGIPVSEVLREKLMETLGATGKSKPLLTRIEEGVEPYGLLAYPIPDGYDPDAWEWGRVSFVTVDAGGEELGAYQIHNEGDVSGEPGASACAYFPGTSPIARIAGETGGFLTVEPVDLEALGASSGALEAIRANGDEPRDMLVAYFGDDEDKSLINAVTFLALPGLLPVMKSVAGKKERRGRGRGTKRIATVTTPIDPVTNALSKPSNKFHPGPSCYWPQADGRGALMTVPTSTKGNRYAALRVWSECEDLVSAATSDYELNYWDRIYRDFAASLIEAGNTGEIRGSQILKAMGVKNPYAASSRNTMIRAAASFAKMRTTPFTVDLTNARRGETGTWNGRTVTSSTYEGYYGNYSIEYIDLSEEDGKALDFAIHPLSSDAAQVFPVWGLGRDFFQQVTAIDVENVTAFDGVNRVTMQDIGVMYYIFERVLSQGMGNVIKFDTLITDLQLFDDDGSANPHNLKRKRDRLIKRVGELLRAKTKEGPRRTFKGWEYTYAADGKTVDGVKIEPLPSIAPAKPRKRRYKKRSR